MLHKCHALPASQKLPTQLYHSIHLSQMKKEVYDPFMFPFLALKYIFQLESTNKVYCQ